VRSSADPGADLGDIVLLLLAGTLAGLRDRLDGDGFARAADLIGDLVEIVDDYLTRLSPGDRSPGSGAR
jgi:hypothetical protein